MNILVTGSAGFIGFHLTKALLLQGYSVVGIDNLNSYYDPELKKDRLRELERFCIEHECVDRYHFEMIDIAIKEQISNIFKNNIFDRVVNLAAQAGVRYSIENPSAYIDSNIVGFLNILEGCRGQKVGHLIYASSSSIYGMSKKVPFSTDDRVDSPISLYAATKKSNELMAHTYSHLYGIPTTGLRFFTVYGPWGRPDMAYFGFTKKILAGEPIEVFNGGDMQRDFTFIDDIIAGVMGLVNVVPASLSSKDSGAKAPYVIYNVGNNKPVKLMDFISSIENAVGKNANIESLPMQPGDVPVTYADISSLKEATGFEPKVNIADGIRKFVDWYVPYVSRG